MAKQAKLRGLSLFANVGVAEAYLKEIGVDMLVANELIPERARFYQDVYPETHMITGDITDDKMRTSIIFEAKKKKVNFVMATPPCQEGTEKGIYFYILENRLFEEFFKFLQVCSNFRFSRGYYQKKRGILPLFPIFIVQDSVYSHKI